MRPCPGWECEKKLSDSYTPMLCPPCEAKLTTTLRDGFAALNHLLQLEAEFVQWCATHGQPHPHER